MGTENTYEVVNGGVLFCKKAEELGLPEYMIADYAKRGTAVILLQLTFNDAKIGSRYEIGVVNHEGNKVLNKGMGHWLRYWLIPDDIIDKIAEKIGELKLDAAELLL